jgi:hypothetical protein
MECTNLVDPHAVVPLVTVVFVLLGIYTPPPQDRLSNLFWILSDSNVSFDGQSSFFPGFVKYGTIVAKD